MTHPTGPSGPRPDGDSGTGPTKSANFVRAVGDYAAIGLQIARMTGLLLADVIRDTLAQRRFRKAGGAR